MPSPLLTAPSPVERAGPRPRLRWLRYEPEPRGWATEARPAGPAPDRAPPDRAAAAPPGRRDAPGLLSAGPPRPRNTPDRPSTLPPGPPDAVDTDDLVQPAPGAAPISPRQPPAARRTADRRDASPAEWVEAHHTAARHLRTALEVLAGRRPVAHIADQVAPPVLRYWRVAAQQRRVHGPARFTRMRLCLPRSGVAEVAVTCELDGRPRALAARFERTRGRWLCTAVRLG
jgi:Family of unknown function (DUF6459)